MDKQKTAATVLTHALAHVPFDGWSQAALERGAKEAGINPKELIRIFPGGARDAVVLFTQQADDAMLKAYAALEPKPAKIREKIAMLVRLKLTQYAQHREAVRKLVGFFALPHHTHMGLSALYHTVDEMWHAAGDASADFNWYTKRALLSGVYTSTLLYWLNDTSDDYADTWEFLDRRIGEVMQIQKAKQRLTGFFNAS